VGAISWRARLHVAWSLATIVVLIVLVRLDGITGAALAHLILFIPFATVYVIWGTRRLATDGRVFVRALQAVVVPVACQAALTVAVLFLLEQVTTPLLATSASALTGLLLVIALFGRFTPVLAGECRAFMAAFAGRRS
jgi:hypothetical protein